MNLTSYILLKLCCWKQQYGKQSETNSKLGNKDPENKGPCYRQTGLFSTAEVARTINEHGWGADQIKEREQRMIAWIREKWE